MDSLRRTRSHGGNQCYRGDPMHAVKHVREVSKTLAAIKNGSVLRRNGPDFWLEPNGGRVPTDVAEWVIIDPRVETKVDAFSYIAQTWRYVSEEVSLYERVAEAPEGGPEGAGAAAAGPGSPPL